MVDTASTEPALEESDIFHILGNDRRRAIVVELADRPERVDVSTVATAVAARETDDEEVPNNLYKSVYVSLQQTHLPQLESDGVISYDPDEKTIARGPQFDRVRTYLTATQRSIEGGVVAVLAIAVVGLATTFLSGVDAIGFASLAPAVWGSLALCVIALVSGYRLFVR
ncbi:DUF7344 domain-containing protein [Halovivax limisalsi]|uniref:DUF7344 domain-containing protein n=1 Tax=Halovivax limisalsi TaxID=1453760 RepID=UPI001FFDE1EB|nr:ArsR family transcriptional regulator [Halovivax limisalsi]